MFWDDSDYTYTNDSDGMTFYGYDDGDGHVDWYTDSGDLDCTTSTGFSNDDEW